MFHTKKKPRDLLYTAGCAIIQRTKDKLNYNYLFFLSKGQRQNANLIHTKGCPILKMNNHSTSTPQYNAI